MKKEDPLLSRLIQCILGISPSDSFYKNAYDYTNKFLREHSMLYIPKPREIEEKIISLAEKLEINTQFEKSKLILDYVERLKMVFDKKTVIQKEFLFSSINLVMQLAHSPLINTRNIDMMRELFENRYIRNEYNKIVKNKYIAEDIEVIKTVEFEKVDYDEKTESWSSENEKVEEEKNAMNCDGDGNGDNNDDRNNINQLLKNNESIVNTQHIKIRPKDTFQSLFYTYQKLFVNQSYFKQMPEIFFDHLIKINQRYIDKDYQENIFNSFVDSDYVLNRILYLMSLSDDDKISNPQFFLDKFNSLTIVDMSQELLGHILLKFKEQRNNINYLRNIHHILQKNDISSVIISKLSSIVSSFINIHDAIIDRFMKVLYYQKGKIENIKEIYDKILFIDPYKAQQGEENHMVFIDILVGKANEFIASLLSNKGKITILNVLNFYYKYFEPTHLYFVMIIQEIIATKQQLAALNKYAPTVLIKILLDKMYSLCRNNQLLNMEVFICLIDVYTKFIYEFIINGNLIDIHNEFFIDHLLTKGESKKFIFCFNKKYQIFDWVECFKIKNNNINNTEGPCVPLVFMHNNLYFKLLETAKTTFLLKNLKVASYLNNFNKELLFANKIDYSIFFKLKRDDCIDDTRKYISDQQSIDEWVPNEEFNELKLLNERLKVSKKEIETTFNEVPVFGEDVKERHHITKNIMNFSSGERNIELNPDIEMEDLTAEYLLVNKDKVNQITNEEEDTNQFVSQRANSADNQEIKEICNMILNNNMTKTVIPVKQSNITFFYNIDIILSHLFFNHIIFINKVINTKFLEILHENLHIHEHFDLMLHLFLFKAGFSMNKFIGELNTFIFNQAKQSNRISIDHNFYLKNTLVELSSYLGSDLKPYKDKIDKHLHVSFKEETNLLFHSNSDLIFMDYQPDLPISIFFDKGIIAYYNAVFNYIVKIKRTFIIIRDISIDKQLKGFLPRNITQSCIIKNFISYRMIILNFAVNFEFFMFHFVINSFIEKFKQKSVSLNSIDQYINSHNRFIKNIYISLGLNDAALIKKIYKILNLIVAFPPLLNRFQLTNESDDKAIEELYMELINSIEKFNRKERKINDSINILKEKLILK